MLKFVNDIGCWSPALQQVVIPYLILCKCSLARPAYHALDCEQAGWCIIFYVFCAVGFMKKRKPAEMAFYLFV